MSLPLKVCEFYLNAADVTEKPSLFRCFCPSETTKTSFSVQLLCLALPACSVRVKATRFVFA